MNIYVLYENRAFENPIKYTFDVLLTTLGIDYRIAHYEQARVEGQDKAICILYGDKDILPQAKFKIHIYPAILFGQAYLKVGSLPHLPLDRVKIEGKDRAILYAGKGRCEGRQEVSAKGRELVGVKEDDTGRTIFTNLDIIASSFFLLSRYEELLSNREDKYKRFPAEESLCYKEGLLCQPIVNDYLSLLETWIDSFSLGLTRKPSWPDGKRFAVCLTHDVDHVKRWRIKSILVEAKCCFDLLVRKRKLSSSIKRGLKVLDSVAKRENPWWNFEEIIEKEKEYGFSSSFYFLAGKRHPLDGSYKINEAPVQALIKGLASRGVEVGLHGSHTSYKDEQRLSEELQALSQVAGNVSGIRQHNLRFDSQETFAIQEKLGFKYDTTLGFAQHEGWRSSFSFPYHPWNFRQNRPFKILEIPLTIMDATLSEVEHRGLTAEEAWEATKKILSATEQSGGCATLLWHNSHFDDLHAPGFGEVYEKALKWIYERNGWGTSGYEIYKWWHKER